jgi:hypothetical protein
MRQYLSPTILTKALGQRVDGAGEHGRVYGGSFGGRHVFEKEFAFQALRWSICDCKKDGFVGGVEAKFIFVGC